MKRKNWQLPESDVTDKEVYLNRRGFIEALAIGTAAVVAPNIMANESRSVLRHKPEIQAAGSAPDWLKAKLDATTPGAFYAEDKVTPYPYITQYNNFYEFGTDKSDPYENAVEFRTDPWSVEIGGEAEITGKFTLEDILSPHDLEERIYRLRCVEAWSMVVPWVGFPLADLLKRFKPTLEARYVRFKTLLDPAQMPGQRSLFKAIDYPYVEGLRIDEAMNELAFMSVGLYGDVMPPQNGAPLRLVVPWKYGFKSIKSIVKIEFLKKRPKTTWELSNAREYGFFANVNPEVDHPRWSQATERRLPNSLFSPSRMDTLKFNGYGDQVAHLYANMNLKANF